MVLLLLLLQVLLLLPLLQVPPVLLLLQVLLLLLPHLQLHSHSPEGSVKGRPESEDPGSSLVGQKMQPLVVPQPWDTDVICCFPDLWDFWTRLHSLRYGLLRPPILLENS